MHGNAPSAKTKPVRKRSRKAFWLKQLHTWHWMSSAISLIGLLLFAFTGITLNHAADIEASPAIAEHGATLPAPLLEQIAAQSDAAAIADAHDGRAPLPAPVRRWLEGNLPMGASGEAEWMPDEVYLARPRPGGDGWIAIDRATGAITAETTDRGWIAYLNDLHKGRNAGSAWAWFIDIFAVACFVFALTGLVLLQLHARNRRSTWPLVAAGLVLPALVAIFLIH
ncbi:PepSY-associated TM helix domain-containing protein [Stakelama tenebrarum]|uniref:Peptidase n=1 Tax=Stakelama tenebrarum TaxID=2711215 RepID=A0A6G6Y2Q5_9SPHN|nr:PepSY-associated TM helix domain-containing protein [Sphingosinithalassobacter tenebrarum]QIG79205.1 hypothetical protein G5C33_04965 [Sphingosinithalassobacter tenebrarum]